MDSLGGQTSGWVGYISLMFRIRHLQECAIRSSSVMMMGHLPTSLRCYSGHMIHINGRPISNRNGGKTPNGICEPLHRGQLQTTRVCMTCQNWAFPRPCNRSLFHACTASRSEQAVEPKKERKKKKEKKERETLWLPGG
jgi:hypothetical protein